MKLVYGVLLGNITIHYLTTYRRAHLDAYDRLARYRIRECLECLNVLSL